jgi:glycosyltransferase involved in cell wall biosynthesis
MRRLLRTAAAIVTTTPEAARRIGDAFPELSDRPIVSIPNGFSAEAFATTPPARSDGQFRIVHTGSLHTDLGRRQREITPVRRLLGGGATATDLLARSHVYLLEAVERLVARDACLADVIEVHFAGVLSPADELEARRLSQSRLHGHLGHAESVELMQTADLLFLPMQKMPHGMRATIVPGKTYEYLAAGPAILAAVPEGDARDILVDAGTARICEPDDVDGMADAIAAEVASWRAGRSGPRVAAPILAPFERRAVAASYAELLASVVPPRTAASRQPRTAPSGEDREAVPSDSLRCDSRR